jgi:hypothetical protein
MLLHQPEINSNLNLAYFPIGLSTLKITKHFFNLISKQWI